LGIPPLASPETEAPNGLAVDEEDEGGVMLAKAEEVVEPEIVTGATPVELLWAWAEPELEMLNWLDWARMAAFPIVEVTKLIWKAVPTGQVPPG
jgi:hypothetical protein